MHKEIDPVCGMGVNPSHRQVQDPLQGESLLLLLTRL